MKTKALALILGVAFGTVALAESMSQAEYRAEKQRIETEYKSARSACVAFMGNARDICVAEADANVKVARADLEARFKPSQAAAYKVRVAHASADYAVALETCEEQPASARSICVRDAKATLAAAKAKAR